MTKIIKDDENKTKLRSLLKNPVFLTRIHRKMVQLFAQWALETPGSQPRILKYKEEFKTIVEACLNAKVDVDEREVLLALSILAEEFAGAVVLGHVDLVEKVEEPETAEVTH